MIDDAAACIEHEQVLQSARIRHDVVQQYPDGVFVGHPGIGRNRERCLGELQGFFEIDRDFERMAGGELCEGAEFARGGDDRLGPELHEQACKQTSCHSDIGQDQSCCPGGETGPSLAGGNAGGG